MKPSRYILTLLAALLWFTASSEARSLDISSSILLERYTILPGDIGVEYATGYLQRNGRFKTVLSNIADPRFYDSVYDFAEVSGRPLMPEMLFDGYKSSGALPNWVRSRDSFDVGFSTYVIVSTKGGLDPNPQPTILDQPESERVLAGETAWFFVDALPWSVSYQWYFKNKPIRGATDFALAINPVTKASAGLYSVAVSNGGKPLMSKKARLTVVQPVTIKTQPKSQTIRTGKNVTLRTFAKGTGPFSYQWYWNDQPIANATKSFYTIKKAQPVNSGTYYVVVDNGPSSATSNGALITVNP